MTEERWEQVPQWKRELISRRRSSARTASVGPLQLTCLGAGKVFGEPQPPVLPGMRVPSAPPDIQHILTEIEENRLVKMVEEKNTKNHSIAKREFTVDEENMSDSSEEFKYGPGIVNKLKSKYLSLTLRESNAKVRPSLSNMRRATSLENLLDETLNSADETPKQQKFVKNSHVSNGGAVQYRRAFSRNKDYMKRARSVETLERYNRSPEMLSQSKEIIRNEDICQQELDEGKDKLRHSVEKTELPPPDLVKSTLRLFEPKGSVAGQKLPSTFGPVTKPAILPKPKTFDLKNRINIIANGNDVVANPEPKIRLRSDESSRIRIMKELKIPADVEIIEKFESDTTKIVSPNKVTKPPLPKRDETDSCPLTPHRENVARAVTPEEPKRPALFTQNLSFEKPPTVPSPKPRTSPKVVEASSLTGSPITSQGKTPSSPGSQMKQVGVIRPIVTSKSPSPPATQHKFGGNRMNEFDFEKNYLNNIKSIEQPVTKVIVSLKKSAEECTTAAPAKAREENPTISSTWGPKPHSMVFNFSKRKNVPDYIENDGLIITSKKEAPKRGDSGYVILGGGTADATSDFEVEDLQGPPSPCQIIVIGGNILINGKSSLQKAPKQIKLRIKFKDEATTFEYPSESSLLEDSVIDSPKTSASPISIPIKSGTLASYTPIQLAHSASFELGVTKTQPVSAPTPMPVEVDEDVEEYLRPADDSKTVSWSADTAEDLLF